MIKKKKTSSRSKIDSSASILITFVRRCYSRPATGV
nr:MAG TPA: hypothetical protein [Caudoviricetes sp.]